MGPLGHVLQDMAAGGDMAAAGGDMAAAAAAGGDMAAMTEAMMPAMTMSFLLPGIGLGLLKGMLLGNTISTSIFFISVYLQPSCSETAIEATATATATSSSEATVRPRLSTEVTSSRSTDTATRRRNENISSKLAAC